MWMPLPLALVSEAAHNVDYHGVCSVVYHIGFIFPQLDIVAWVLGKKEGGAPP